MAILNLTQHPATPEQLAAGVVDPQPEVYEEIRSLLTFDDNPSWDVVEQRACWLRDIALQHAPEHNGFQAVMLGGAPWFMAPLEYVLKYEGIQCLYAFSRRESVEQTQPDGSVRKINVFRHVGFVGEVEVN